MLHLFDGAAWVNIGPGAGSGGAAAVGTTPPANPAVGTLWWNNANLQVWNGTSWMATSGVTEVLRMGFPTTVATATNTWVQVPFASAPMIDTQNAWNAATHQYTPNVPGYYIFFVRSWATVTVTAGSFGQYATDLVKNDPGAFTADTTVNAVCNSSIRPGVTVTGEWMTTGGISQFNGTTDFVRLWTYSTDGKFNSTGSQPVLTGYLLH